MPIELLALQQQAAYQAASLATQKEIASMEIASRQALSQQEMALQRELQAGNIDLQKYLQQRELAQRESEFSRTYVIQQAQQKLQELRFEFDKQLAAATLRANPRDWVANAYFQRGLKPGDPMLGGQTARTDEELRNMPWLRSIQTNQALPKFQAPAGQVGEGGPFGIEALSPLQITAPVWNSLSNVEREMAGGAVSAQGQDPADFFARMYASQIRGRAGPGQFSVN